MYIIRIVIRTFTIGYSLTMLSLLREKSMCLIALNGCNKMFTQRKSNIYGRIDRFVLCGIFENRSSYMPVATIKTDAPEKTQKYNQK